MIQFIQPYYPGTIFLGYYFRMILNLDIWLAFSSFKNIFFFHFLGDDFNVGTAFRYEMRCYTNPQTLVSDRQFLNKAIPVHESLLPSPKVSKLTLKRK